MNKLVNVSRSLKGRRPSVKRDTASFAYLTLEQLSECSSRVRRLELSAFRAENLLMRLALGKNESTMPVTVALPTVIYTNLTSVEAVRMVVNGEAMNVGELRKAVADKFPHFECTSRDVSESLSHLFKRKEVTRTGERTRYRYLKSLVPLVVLLPLLFGCRTGTPKPTHDPIPAAIMPRWMPDAPRPAETVKAIPTTVSRSLSWTHDPAPGLLTYRVDYGEISEPLTNSLMTQANNCTIWGLSLNRTYTFRVVGCDGRRYSELENLRLIIKE